MEVQIAVAKTNKYAVSESGDTVEVIERPNGGLSIIMADGQSSGRGAKAVSMQVVQQVVSLLADGVRDGAAARAASDRLFTAKQGRVSCTLNIISIDLLSRSLVISRNNPAPVYICRTDSIRPLEEESIPLGTYRNTRPLINELDIAECLTIVAYTDGLVHAGKRNGHPMNVKAALEDLFSDEPPEARWLADSLLMQAVRLDDGRPADDISVVVVQVRQSENDHIRRMQVRLPFD